MFSLEFRKINSIFSQKMPGSLENVLDWCSFFYNSEGCIYHHMNSETLFQIFKNTICMLKLLLLNDTMATIS